MLVTIVQKFFLLTFCLILLSANLAAQESNDVISGIEGASATIQLRIDKKISKIKGVFEKRLVKQLRKLQKHDNSIYEKLRRKDSVLANNYLEQAKQMMAELEDKLSDSGKVTVYIANLDTLQTALTFWEDSLQVNSREGQSNAAKVLLLHVNQLQHKVQQAEILKKFLRKRRDYITAQLSKHGLVKELKRINKQVYYYSQQFNEYKSILSNPKKIGTKALGLLCKSPRFKAFFQKNSLLATLFPSRDGANMVNTTAFLTANPNLQTRSMLNGLVQQQIAVAGPNAQAAFQQNLQDAQAQIAQLKDKVLQNGMSNSSDELPNGFRPNNQKTKTFLQRLEYGTNIQVAKASSYFPVTSNIALSIGYKLNDKSIIGIGASFKLGFGSGWNNIKLTGQGIGLRSFIDWKIKGNFYLSGGYEQNYYAAITGLVQFPNQSAWQQSGLIGITKSIPIKTKFFKKTNLKLFWDFLSYKQVPRVQPLVFRIGYNF